MQTAREDGLTAGVKSFFQHCKNIVRGKAIGWYWMLRGKREIDVNGTTCTFRTSNVSEALSAGVAEDGSERRGLEQLLDEVEETDVVYDIGAHIGVYTCFLSRAVGDDGKVIAFEPKPPHVDALEANRELNELNYEIVAEPLLDERQPITLTQPVEQTHSATGVSQTDNGELEAVAGDELVERDDLPLPDVIKVDTEGAEKSILDGLEQTIRESDCRLILVEVHHPKPGRPSIQDFNSSQEELVQFLESLGFDVETFIERSGETMLVAR